MAPSQTNNSNNHRISAVREDKSKGKGKTGKETGVELRYYTKKEYAKLSHDERKELAELRKNKKTNEKSSATSDKTISALQKQVKDLEERLIAVINTQSNDNRISDGGLEPSNRAPLTNPLNQRN